MGIVKGCANVGWLLGGDSAVGMGDGGNLSRDLGSDVALTASTAVLVPRSPEDTADAMVESEC